MEPDKLKTLQDRLRNLQQEVEALMAQAQEFPALACNGRRVQACLAMMLMDLGHSALGQA